MDPKTSFKIPLLLRQKRPSQGLNSDAAERLNRSFSSTQTYNSLNNSRSQIRVLPLISTKLNPGYRHDLSLAKSESQTQFPNHFISKKQISLDNKLYFRRKDELSNYAEHLLRNKFLYSK